MEDCEVHSVILGMFWSLYNFWDIGDREIKIEDGDLGWLPVPNSRGPMTFTSFGILNNMS